jgi:hypothetical protein
MSGLDVELINHVRKRGGSIGNVTLIRELGWSAEEYWQVRDRLVIEGKLLLGRGRGGSVRLVDMPTERPQPGQRTVNEDALYVPMQRVLQDEWCNDQRFDHAIVEITGRQGSRDTGGVWTRPDIIVASLTTLVFVPGKHFDLVTFEVKPLKALNVTAVYEALAHRRCATRSYLLIHLPEEHKEDELVEQLLDRIHGEAKRLGVGVILAGDPSDYETWEESVEAEFHDPSPHALNDFISIQLSEKTKTEITRWLR